MNRQRRSEPGADEVARSAAAWFVALDQGELTEAQNHAFEAWMLADPRHAAALTDCAEAIELGAHVDPAQWQAPVRAPVGIRAGQAGRAGHAAGQAGQAGFGGRLAAWLQPLGQPAVAWSVTAVALVFALVSWLQAPTHSDVLGSDAPGSFDSDVSIERRESSTVEFPVDRLPMAPVVLQGNLVVDSLSFAVQRFQPAQVDDVADHRAANELYDRLTARLAAVPGFYVLGARSTDPYAGLDMEPGTVAAQLGVRTIVQATVSAESGAINLDLRLIDASRNVSYLMHGQSHSMAGIDALLDQMLQEIFEAMTSPMLISAVWNDN